MVSAFVGKIPLKNVKFLECALCLQGQQSVRSVTGRLRLLPRPDVKLAVTLCRPLLKDKNELAKTGKMC